MYRPEGLIIDNETVKLFEELNRILREQKSVDIATAYFNVAGFQLIQDGIMGVRRCRLLLGVLPDKEDRQPDLFEPEQIYKKNLRTDLEDEEFERVKKETVTKLIEFLKRESTEVKLYNKGFLHGKVYLFDKLAIIGSSNFTYSGFTSNTELNAVLDEAHSRFIREEWFEKFWRNSVNFKEELIRIIDESKFGTKEYPPFHIFIKALYELQKEDILFEFETPEALPSSEVDLANFQEDAVRRIYSRLETYNGVLVADSVGLGKTWIAKKIIEDFGFYRRRRFLVICPASVDETLWRPALKSIGVSENILHQELLGSKEIDFKEIEKRLNFKLEDIALIVVDESHNFRNPLSNRYEGLFTLIERASKKQKPKVLLLTATPMNNTFWDLYYQLMLIARNNKRIFVKDGIFDLEKQFRKAEKGDVTTIGDIMQIISIRRTRQYIKANYPDAKYRDENGNWIAIKFPERKLFEVNYSLDETYQGLYYKIAEKIESGEEEAKEEGRALNLAYYRLEEYRIRGAKDKFALGRMIALGGIFQTILLKRLESSVEAFRKSIQAQIDFLTIFRDIFKEGKILRKDFFNNYLKYLINLSEDSEEVENIIEDIKGSLTPVDLSEYDEGKFLEDLEKDIQVFKEIKKLVEPIDTENDAKLNELKRMLINLRDKGKCIIFSYYADTIDYLYKALTGDEKFMKEYGKRVAMLTGRYSTGQRKNILDEFLNSDIDLLLSTDILSEGQNLQKARIVINYDLHWNPVRMIQRAGRIDRIGSPFDEIYIYNFYPEKELESLLELVKILQFKIEKINESVGLDASILGEKINPRVFGIIRDLRRDDKTKEMIQAELEEQQFGGGEQFWQPLKDFGLDKLQEFCESLPHGIQSGLKKGIKGVFFYYKYEEEFHFWFLYDISNNRTITNKTEILEFISCKENEPRVIPEDIDVFSIHRRVREDIKRIFSEEKMAVHVRTVHGRMDKSLRDLRDELDYIRENELEDNASRERISQIISAIPKIPLTKKRMQTVRKIYKEYKTTRNWQRLISTLEEFLKEKPVIEEEEPIEFDERKLKLICVDFVS